MSNQNNINKIAERYFENHKDNTNKYSILIFKMPKSLKRKTKTNFEKRKILEKFNQQIISNQTKIRFSIGQNEYKKNIKFIKHIDYVPYSVESNNLPIYFDFEHELESFYDSYSIKLTVEHTSNKQNNLEPNETNYKTVCFPGTKDLDEIISIDDKKLTVIKHNTKFFKEFLKQNGLNHENCPLITKYLNSIVYETDFSLKKLLIPIHLGFFFKSNDICNDRNQKLDYLRVKAEVKFVNHSFQIEKSFHVFSQPIFLCKTKNDIHMMDTIENIIQFQNERKMSFMFEKHSQALYDFCQLK